MEILLVILSFMTVVVVAGYLALPLWAWLLANFDVFFTFVPEGTAKAIMRGQEFHKFLIRSEGFKILRTEPEATDYHRHELLADPRAKLHEVWDIVSLLTGEKPDHGQWYEKMSGTRWMGIWPFFKLYRYQFQWVVPKQVESQNKIKIVPNYRDLLIDNIFIREAVYYGIVEAAETTDNTPVDVEYLLTVRVINPYKALFRIHRWLEAVLDLTSQRGRQYIGTKSYKQLVAEEEDAQNKGFSGGIMKLRKDLTTRFGVFCVYADIASVEFSGTSHDKYVEISTKAYTSEQERINVVTKAKGDSEAAELAGVGKAKALKVQVEAYNLNPAAAQAILDIEAKKALNVGSIADAVFGRKGGNP